ncbi:MAG: TIGR01777 family protein [Deltaproteobacteria bacterium]|nr:TIGR01777 family protein [Deltaproteobacteria bacterium]
MKILITGGLGFVGTCLTGRFLEEGHSVTSLDRAPHARLAHPGYAYLSADTTLPGPWQEVVATHDAVVNLAGATIFKRWNDAYKKAVWDSRILTTRNLVQAIPEGSGITLLSTSAAGYYGFRGDEECSEDTLPGDDFLARVCVGWETEAKKAADRGARVVITRFGVVFGKNGGALSQMAKTFRLGVGGPLGSGNQWFSWIHIEDLASAMLFCLNNKAVSGPLNFMAPYPVRNRDMAKALGRVLKRPAVIPAPAWAVKLALGEFGDAILHGQRGVPTGLSKLGFTFKYPEIEGAMREVLFS